MAVRLGKEVSKCDTQFELKFVSEGNTSKLTAVIPGPEEPSIWAGGRFTVSITLPADYPFSPPKIKFTSPMFHPNVYDKGTEAVTELGIGAKGKGDICVDILDKAWTPAMTINAALKSIQSMLDSPNIDSPANIDAAKLYRDDKDMYNAMVASLIADQKGGQRRTRRGSHKRSRRTRRK
jgi:ubiquitin-protein ligase